MCKLGYRQHLGNRKHVKEGGPNRQDIQRFRSLMTEWGRKHNTKSLGNFNSKADNAGRALWVL